MFDFKLMTLQLVAGNINQSHQTSPTSTPNCCLYCLLFHGAPINLTCVWSSDILGDKNNFLPAFPVSLGHRPACPGYAFIWSSMCAAESGAVWSHQTSRFYVFSALYYCYSLFLQGAGGKARQGWGLFTGRAGVGGGRWGRFVWRITMTCIGQTKSQVQIYNLFTSASQSHRNKHLSTSSLTHSNQIISQCSASQSIAKARNHFNIRKYQKLDRNCRKFFLNEYYSSQWW